MNLKTLKDFESESMTLESNGFMECSECGKSKFKGSVSLYAKSTLTQLRQEAIKHIKKLNTSVERGKRLHSINIQKRAEGKIDWIKSFFNITEEELR